MDIPGTAYQVEINPKIPERLSRLQELAHDLWYSWDRPTRQLFARLDPRLWNDVGYSPKVLLRRIDERRLLEAAANPGFLHSYDRILAAYDSYLGELRPRSGAPGALGDLDLIAYFCAEFGFHESLPIYSGGLGILAGDHCKAASDARLPFVGVGLLYRQGYFQQTIDNDGSQHALYRDSDFDELPVTPVSGANGEEIRVEVNLPARTVKIRIWQVRVGWVRLYLLDTDLRENSERDRHITHRLYGGDRDMRICQEIVLGIGGVRALAALGIEPTAWHMNEGHAAFLVLERVRQRMLTGLDFPGSLEAVAASTLFTTHTAVAAGHDRFDAEMISGYFDGYCREFGLDPKQLFALGHTPGRGDFDMTTLAVRGSRFHNGVSRIHGDVSARMLHYLWPQIQADENPVTYVTNAVHVPTYLSPDWYSDFDRFLGFGWTERPGDSALWARVEELPDYLIWSRHQFLKSQMLALVRQRITVQHDRNRRSQSHLDRMLRLADPANPNVLTIGFGRRFATYKRATLLLDDLERLKRIIGDPQRPVLFIFAGKAHPADVPGQELIRELARISRMPEFEGRILLVEGYDLRLARRLVCGVDVWLNNPIYPLEASGTSGMKAGINGVLNLSVLDGWWDEGYTGDNGWAIKPASDALEQSKRDHEEAGTLYEILQDQVLPQYYRRGEMGYSPEWTRRMKRSISTILPHFNTSRMLGDYVRKFYEPAARQGRLYARDSFETARAVAAWKRRVREAWPGVRAQRLDPPARRLPFGTALRVEVAVALNGLDPADVRVEVPAFKADASDGPSACYPLKCTGTDPATGEFRYLAEFVPDSCGRYDYRIRVYPYRDALTHRFETGLMIWV